ncbi:MAG TPA: hypothetical protein DEB17_07950 [Chlorobaculum sp.]|uniref:Uncharacterized protein n=1 Tax=Chlorobaculum tepidum (strain ATCC 49652 / DSM 12025 / NBRC 103806 / TLS) TaxID=194439 RepID=Q8KD31_CHLTE|nr:hypothetical protein CT1224 [Chlorobaculum tepidum TLS]HBU23904.1 hypothetical protein [Chlorobaculum sp.]
MSNNFTGYMTLISYGWTNRMVKCNFQNVRWKFPETIPRRKIQ